MAQEAVTGLTWGEQDISFEPPPRRLLRPGGRRPRPRRRPLSQAWWQVKRVAQVARVCGKPRACVEAGAARARSGTSRVCEYMDISGGIVPPYMRACELTFVRC